MFCMGETTKNLNAQSVEHLIPQICLTVKQYSSLFAILKQLFATSYKSQRISRWNIHPTEANKPADFY